MGNCVTVARQTLTLFVGVRIPIPQPENGKFLLELAVLLFIVNFPLLTALAIIFQWRCEKAKIHIIPTVKNKYSY